MSAFRRHSDLMKFTPPSVDSAGLIPVGKDSTPLLELEVKPRTGAAVPVRRGQVIRIGQPEGPQVCDFNAFAEQDTWEHFWSGRTRILERAHLSTGSRLWSMRVRPMFTIVADTMQDRETQYNGGIHDLIFARCSRELWRLAEAREEPNSCQDNLAAAVADFGIAPQQIHDAFNIYMRTGVDPSDDNLFIEPTDSIAGDYIELRAEMDAIAAVSACPVGDATAARTCRPLSLEVFDMDALQDRR